MSGLLNKAKDALGGDKSQSSSGGSAPAQGGAGAGQEDYGDKGIDAVGLISESCPSMLQLVSKWWFWWIFN